MPELVGYLKVRFSEEEIREFNRTWPCSTLRENRTYWFEFDTSGDLVDVDVPEQDDGPAAIALAEQAKEWLEEHQYFPKRKHA